MKISELIATLEHQRHLFGDLEVRGTWGGVVVEFDADNIYVGTAGLRKDQQVLFLDMDGNSYRSDFTGVSP